MEKYIFYLGDVMLPINPSELNTKIKNNNKETTLINNGSINFLKDAGLTEISFDFIIPIQNYSLSTYQSGVFQSSKTFTDKLEQWKLKKEVIKFVVVRKFNDNLIFPTDIDVSVEDYTIKETSKHNGDLDISIKLKQYNKITTGTEIVIKQNEDGSKKQIETKIRANNVEKQTTQTYSVVSGDTLWSICKKYYGDGNLCYKLATFNNISNPNKINIGQVLKIPTKESLSGTSPTYATTPKTNKQANTNSSTTIGKNSNLNQTTQLVDLKIGQVKQSLTQIDTISKLQPVSNGVNQMTQVSKLQPISNGVNQMTQTVLLTNVKGWKELK